VIGPVELISAFFLDLAIGDPRWLPHPVRMIGRAICFLEGRLRSLFGKNREKEAGILLVLLIVLPAAFAAYFISEALLFPSRGVLMVVGMVVMVYLVAATIALRELVSSARLVINSVKEGNIAAARSNLSMIVGRDTGSLNEDGVLRGVIETVAENLSDGVIAPLFYFVIGGLPLAIAYKAINTLDSMVGYKNEKYISFGWAAARLDDIANFIPARITGLLIVIASFCYFLTSQPGLALSAARRSLSVMVRDGRKHTSPNSGIPEAAMAGCLGVRLGGPSTYGGLLVQKPFIGDNRNEDYRRAAEHATAIVLVAAVAAVLGGVMLLRMRESA
jgi:adenosylcobinamide-phosphate synthase